MAIAKKPESSRSAIAAHLDDERAAEAFISAADSEPSEQDTKKIPVLVRFDGTILKRIDREAKRRGISRTAWIHFMVSRALEQEET